MKRDGGGCGEPGSYILMYAVVLKIKFLGKFNKWIIYYYLYLSFK